MRTELESLQQALQERQTKLDARAAGLETATE